MGSFHGIALSVLFKHVVFDNVGFSFLLQTQKFYIKLNRNKGKEKKNQNPKQNHKQAIDQKSKSLLFCGTIFIINVCGLKIKDKHIP